MSNKTIRLFELKGVDPDCGVEEVGMLEWAFVGLGELTGSWGQEALTESWGSREC